MSPPDAAPPVNVLVRGWFHRAAGSPGAGSGSAGQARAAVQSRDAAGRRGVRAHQCRSHSLVALVKGGCRCDQEFLARLDCPFDPFAGRFRPPNGRCTTPTAASTRAPLTKAGFSRLASLIRADPGQAGQVPETGIATYRPGPSGSAVEAAGVRGGRIVPREPTRQTWLPSPLRTAHGRRVLRSLGPLTRGLARPREGARERPPTQRLDAVLRGCCPRSGAAPPPRCAANADAPVPRSGKPDGACCAPASTSPMSSSPRCGTRCWARGRSASHSRNAFGFRNADNQRLRTHCVTTRRARRHLHTAQL